MTHAHAEFDPDCEDCRPAMLDVETGLKLPKDHPTMVLVNAAWDASPLEEKQACFRIWVHSSRDKRDAQLAQRFFDRVQALITQKEGN